MRVLVVAAPRSGTRAFAALLRSMGLDAGHERFGADACVSSYLAVEGTPTHGPHAASGESRAAAVADQVWHLVRHPLDTIGSIAQGMRFGWWRWQEQHTGVSHRMPDPERAASFWLAWMRIIEADPRVCWRLRIEDCESFGTRPQIAERLALSPPRICDAVPAHIGNTRGAERLRLDALKLETAEAVLKKVAEYGYTP